MTPVEAAKTEFRSRLNLFSIAAHIFLVFFIPRLPVQALAQPEFAIIAEIFFFFFSRSISNITGAALTILEVKTAAALAGVLEINRERSFLFFLVDIFAEVVESWKFFGIIFGGLLFLLKDYWGTDTTKDTRHKDARHGKGKSFISYWIATGLQRAPRNDGKSHDYGNDKNEMGNGNGILETATPHPALSRKGGGDDTTKWKTALRDSARSRRMTEALTVFPFGEPSSLARGEGTTRQRQKLY
jgi:hypothetical protein